MGDRFASTTIQETFIPGITSSPTCLSLFIACTFAMESGFA